jgi:hypothetical protein
MTPKRTALDRQPGSLPEIRASRDSVTFTLAPPGIAPGARLVIRCDAQGSEWASIEDLPAGEK